MVIPAPPDAAPAAPQPAAVVTVPETLRPAVERPKAPTAEPAEPPGRSGEAVGRAVALTAPASEAAGSADDPAARDNVGPGHDRSEPPARHKIGRAALGLIAAAALLAVTGSLIIAARRTPGTAAHADVPTTGPESIDPLPPGADAVVRAPGGREVFAVTSRDRHAELVSRLRAKDAQGLIEGIRQGWVVAIDEGARVRVVGTRDEPGVSDGPDWSRIAEIQPHHGTHAGRSLFVFAAALVRADG